MTGWIIFGSILLILILIFTRSVTVTAVYDDHPELTVKILCFTFVRIPQDPKKAARKKEKKRKAEEKAAKKAEKAEAKAKRRSGKSAAEFSVNTETVQPDKSAEKNDETTDADTGTDKEASGNGAAASAKTKKPGKGRKKPGIDAGLIIEYVKSASKPIKRLIRKIRIRNVYIDIVVGSGDAAKTAIKYGAVCSAVYSVTEFLKAYMSTDIKEINIEADFEAEKDDIFAYGVVKLRISTAIGCGLWLGFRLLKTTLGHGKRRSTSGTNRRPARAGAQ